MVFALTTLKPLFRLSRALLDIQKCILSSAIKFVSFRSYYGNLSLFEITGALVFIFSRQFQLQLHCKSFTKGRIFLIPLCIAFSIPNISGFLFLRKKKLNLGSEMGRIKLQTIVGNLLDKLRKLYMNGTVIQKFLTFLKLQKTLSNFCFSEQIFHRKPSLGSLYFVAPFVGGLVARARYQRYHAKPFLICHFLMEKRNENVYKNALPRGSRYVLKRPLFQLTLHK